MSTLAPQRTMFSSTIYNIFFALIDSDFHHGKKWILAGGGNSSNEMPGMFGGMMGPGGNMMGSGYMGPGSMMGPGGDAQLADEFMKLQQDFFRWQQQLLQNQHILHSRVAPLATNPPNLQSVGVCEFLWFYVVQKLSS